MTPCRSLVHLLPVALLLALPGCMGRWQLGDIEALLHPRAEPERGECANNVQPACGERARDAADAPPPVGAR